MLSLVWVFAASWTIAPRLLCPWDFPGKSTGVGCHFLLQGFFPTQGSNTSLLCLLPWQEGSLPLSHSCTYCFFKAILHRLPSAKSLREDQTTTGHLKTSSSLFLSSQKEWLTFQHRSDCLKREKFPLKHQKLRSSSFLPARQFVCRMRKVWVPGWGAALRPTWARPLGRCRGISARSLVHQTRGSPRSERGHLQLSRAHQTRGGAQDWRVSSLAEQGTPNQGGAPGLKGIISGWAGWPNQGGPQEWGGASPAEQGMPNQGGGPQKSGAPAEKGSGIPGWGVSAGERRAKPGEEGVSTGAAVCQSRAQEETSGCPRCGQRPVTPYIQGGWCDSCIYQGYGIQIFFLSGKVVANGERKKSRINSLVLIGFG